MATKELVMNRNTYTADSTALAYSQTEDNGHALADQDIAVEITGSGELVPVTDGAAIIGRLDLVMRSQKSTVTTFGQEIGFKQGAVNGCRLGEGIVGDTGPTIGGQANGYVRAPADGDTSTGRTERSRSRGVVTNIVSNTAGGEVRVTFP